MLGELMINPFEYGGVVGEAAFCNRTSELSRLIEAAQSGERLFVYAERRMGKTSLAHRVMSKLDSREYLPIYVDLWPTDGVDTFITTMAKAITRSTATRADKLLSASKELFSRLHPSLTLDEAGNPSLEFGASPGKDRVPALDEVLDSPRRLAEKTGKRVLMVLDEFQQILSYEDDLVERSLRSAIQQQHRVAYLFLGSRKHLIEGLFADSRRPMYRSAGHFPLGPIALEHWQPFITDRFAASSKNIGAQEVDYLCRYTDGHPFYTQHLAHALWERTPTGSDVEINGIDDAVDLLLRRENYAFSTRWESLTRNQQRFLTGLATDPGFVEPFSSGFARDHGLGSPSNSQRAADSLLKLDLIDREGGSFILADRFFRLWIRRLR